MAKKFNNVAVGGTFDLLHKGHETLLGAAFKNGANVTIGITTDAMNKKTQNITFQNQNQRIKSVKDFLKKNNLIKNAKVVLINDIYGPTLKDKTIDALIVSKETVKGAQLINSARTEKKLKRLPVITVSLVLAQDKKPISSTRILNGEIDRFGKSYKTYLAKITDKKFNEQLRTKLKKPFGMVKKSISKNLNEPVFAVGDATTANLLKAKISPKLSVIDFHVQRKPAFSSLNQLGFIQSNPDFVVKNEAGRVTKSLISEIEKAIKSTFNNQVILINGEDDLAVIPIILLCPLGSTVFYGQPNRGVVQVDVVEGTKEKLLTLLNLV